MKIGLSLSGGGARGIAHLGVLQALEELGIKPNKIAGVSAGAIAGAMYAAGYAPHEIFEMVKKIKITSFLKPSSFKSPGFFNLKVVENFLKKSIPHNSFEQLKIPLMVTATDLHLGETVLFREGNLIKPVIASASIPVLFSPVNHHGKSLVDGGIINNLVVEPLISECDISIAVHTNPFDKNLSINSTRLLLLRCLNLAIHSKDRANFPYFDLVIDIEKLKDISALKLSRADEIFQIGYDSAMEMRDNILALLEKI